MPTYPRTQSEVAALVEAMIAGFIEHPGDFPSIDLAALQTASDEYHAAADALTEAHTAVALAAKVKAAKLEQLNAIAKTQLKQSQIDTAASPHKLGFIGWGPKAELQAMQAPHQPGGLRILSQDVSIGHDIDGENETKGILHLRWKKSAFKRARFVRFYSVERRASGSESTENQPWSDIASSLTNEIVLKSEPTGTRFEYRIKAVNKGGQSLPSNTVAVVL